MLQEPTEMSLPKTKKELQSFPSIINYLFIFLLATTQVCKPLCKLIYVKQNRHGTSHTKTFTKEQKLLIKKDAYMKFYNAGKSLYLETVVSGMPGCQQILH